MKIRGTVFGIAAAVVVTALTTMTNAYERAKAEIDYRNAEVTPDIGSKVGRFDEIGMDRGTDCGIAGELAWLCLCRSLRCDSGLPTLGLDIAERRTYRRRLCHHRQSRLRR